MGAADRNPRSDEFHHAQTSTACDQPDVFATGMIEGEHATTVTDYIIYRRYSCHVIYAS